MREHRSVGELDEAVDERLRVHEHIDALVRRAEKVVGLHQLEALVHERRRVDRDLAAHRPRGVRERLLDGHVLELGARAPAERPAARGDRDALDRARGLAREELVQRGVLGVHRGDPRAGRFGERDHELAADDERLLVREREVDPLAERRDGRREPRRPDERIQDEVGAGPDDELHEPIGAREHLAVGPRLRSSRCHVLVSERDPAHAVRARLLYERLP